MVMAFDSRKSTRDIDCRYTPKAIICQIAAMVGERHNIPAARLNDHAAMFISPVANDPIPIPIMAKGTVSITAASAEIMWLYAFKWGLRVLIRGGDGRLGQLTPPV